MTFEIIRVEEPEQGYLTYVDGFKYPLRGHPLQTRLDAVALEKRAIIATFRFIARLSKSWTSKRVLKSVLLWLGDLYKGDYGQNLNLPIERFSPAGREIVRTLEKINPIKETGWIYLLGVIIDTDMAYRNRVQDLFPLVNGVHDIKRVMEIAIEREKAFEIIDPSQLRKMRNTAKLVSFLLYFKAFKNLATAFFGEIDKEKLIMSIEDRYWCANKFDYNYEGKTYEERMRWKEEEDKDYQRPIKPSEQPNIFIQQPNQAFLRLPRYEALKMAEKAKETIIKTYDAQNH